MSKEEAIAAIAEAGNSRGETFALRLLKKHPQKTEFCRFLVLLASYCAERIHTQRVFDCLTALCGLTFVKDTRSNFAEIPDCTNKFFQA